MKFILFLILSFPAFADVKVCNEFVDSVLNPAVIHDEKAEDHGARFEKDEEKALKFIRSYDVSKLQISEELKFAEKEMNDCKVFNDPKKGEHYCGALFENFNYLRALIHATKNYNWKSSTIELANKNVNSFLKESTMPGIPLIYIALSYSLLQEMNPSQAVKDDRAELEKTIENRKAEAMKNPGTDCVSVQNGMKAERKDAEKFRLKLANLLKEKKK